MTRYNSLIVIILVGLSLFSCDPGKWMNYYGYDFYIRNDSGVPVKMDWGLGLKRIEPDDSVLLVQVWEVIGNGVRGFDVMPDSKYWSNIDSQYYRINKVSLYSEDESLIREWTLETKDDGGHQLFSEEHWKRYDYKLKIESVIRKWIFYITDEDLSLP